MRIIHSANQARNKKSSHSVLDFIKVKMPEMCPSCNFEIVCGVSGVENQTQHCMEVEKQVRRAIAKGLEIYDDDKGQGSTKRE